MICKIEFKIPKHIMTVFWSFGFTFAISTQFYMMLSERSYISLSKEMSREVFNNVIHLTIKSIWPEHVPVFFADFFHSLQRVSNHIRILRISKVWD